MEDKLDDLFSQAPMEVLSLVDAASNKLQVSIPEASTSTRFATPKS